MNEVNKLYRNFNTVLVVVVLILLASLFALVYISQQDPPGSDPGLEIVKNPQVIMPAVITEGETFEYVSKGEKLIASPADIRMQMVCNINGARNTTTVATYSSNRSIGKYDSRSITAISPSSKLISSKDCEMQVIANYTVYQSGRDGELQPIPVPVIATSNKFEFIAKSN